MKWDQGTWDSGTWDSSSTTTDSSTSTHRTRMKRQNYYPSRAAEEVLWLTNFYIKLWQYSAALGLSNARRDAAVADALWLIYVIGTWLPAIRAWQKACTDAAEDARSGPEGAAQTLPAFIPPPLPGANAPYPATVARSPGCLRRIFDLVQELKENDACTEAMCQDLGIVGSAVTPPDLATLQPEIKARVVGNKVEIDWGWDGLSAFLDQLEIQVDRGQGWQVLTYDTTPGYNDTTPHPAAPARWKYRAIWRVDDQQTGQWSPEASVTVG